MAVTYLCFFYYYTLICLYFFSYIYYSLHFKLDDFHSKQVLPPPHNIRSFCELCLLAKWSYIMRRRKYISKNQHHEQKGRKKTKKNKNYICNIVKKCNNLPNSIWYYTILRNLTYDKMIQWAMQCTTYKLKWTNKLK